MSEQDRILIGKICTAHGIKGLVKVKFYGENIDLLDQHGPLYTEKSGSKCIELTVKNAMKDQWVCSIKGVNDRNQAEELRNTELFTYEDNLPDIKDDNEFYYKDLVGMGVRDESDNKIGTIISVHNFGAGDLLEIRPDTGSSFYLPFTKEHVPSIDSESNMTTITNFEIFTADK